MSGELLALLKHNSNSGGSEVFDHLADLLRSSLQNKSDLKGLNNIEIFSYYLRKNKFTQQDLLSQEQLLLSLMAPQQQHPYVQAAHNLKSALSKIQDNRAYQRPNVLQDQQVLKVAGVSIGETNAFHLNNVVKSLAIEHKTSSIRFWGKILGHRDYWVIQGTTNKEHLTQLPPNAQKYGSGANTYSYWVATDLLGLWVELPLVTPEQVAGSRNCKYIFRGNLEEPVLCSHRFRGQEKHLLKCVLARISHSCELAPKGLYKLNEQNPNVIEFEEEFKLPEVAELATVDSWVHLNPNILNQGRCSHYIDPSLSEEQKEALTAELAQKDPVVERLKPIADDKPCEGLGFAANWSVAVAGETVPVSQIGKLEGTNLVYGVACLKNLVWPGATVVGYRGGWTNIYIGYGHRLSQVNTAIRQIGDVQVEAADPVEKPEPNPSKAPAPKEEKKEEEEAPPAE